MPVASAFKPIAPPSASISRTIWPLANPPTAGLHDIWPIVSRFCVNISVRHPIRAAANAASIPACPLPITATSYSVGSLNISNASEYVLTDFLSAIENRAITCPRGGRVKREFFHKILNVRMLIYSAIPILVDHLFPSRHVLKALRCLYGPISNTTQDR